MNVKSLNTASDKDKINHSLPWVGSYFGIPQPEEPETPAPKCIREVEMHILHKDLTTKIVSVRYDNFEYGVGFEEIEMQLRNIAYLDDDAIAHVCYTFDLDSITGARTGKVRTHNPAVRIGSVKWKWYDLIRDIPEDCRDREFVPQIYKTRMSYE